ncbi:Rv3235 family protein [Spongisporangium articulatum]|uniref:Rv3235 family protein n=1 Tax=Spongisporangium articulatum TaxID=3362603 RepID=A0ABW8AKL2_9ACTN
MSVAPELVPETAQQSTGSGPHLRPIPSREPQAASRVALDRPYALRAAPPAPVLPGLELRAARNGLHVVPPQPGPADLEDDCDSDDLDLAAVFPDPGRWSVQFLITALEVAHGSRPASQLVRWVTPSIQEMLQRRGALAVRLRPAPAGVVRSRLRVRAVRACRLAPDLSEVAAVVQDGDRVRAVAMRLEGLGYRWRVTALQIG